jgi:RNA polymerase-binding transcription factor DksA
MAPTESNAPDKPLTAKERAHFEKRLLEERRRALKELNQLGETFGASQTAADGDLTTYPFHMADQGTDTMEQEKNFLFASQEGRLLWNIDAALRRLYRSPDTFGRCESCGNTIAFERLDALPYAHYCIACKQREENSAKARPAAPPESTGSDAGAAPATGAGAS